MAAPAGKPKHNVFIVDDHPLVREWLSNLINQQPDLAVCGEAGEKGSALEAIVSLKPAIVIVDITLEGGSGLELIKDLKTMAPGVATIVLSMHDESLYAERALRAGARGYVMKREVTGHVLQAIRSVLEGKLYLSEEIVMNIARKLVHGRAPAEGSPVETLSDRELEVFQMLGRGQNTRSIADELNVSIKTVQAFCARIKEKLDLANINELLREAVRWHDQDRTE